VSSRRFREVLLGALALAALGRPSAAQTGDARPAGPFVETFGFGEVRVVPDRATLSLSVETKGTSAALAAGANARIQRAVLDTLAALGLRAPDVSTQSFNVAPSYEASVGGRRPSGYVARNAVIVRFTDLTRIAAAIDAALDRGATGVGMLAFTSSASDSATRSATRAAVQKARADAESIAAAMGGELGPLVQVTNAPGDSRAIMLRGVSGGVSSAMATQITPGDVSVSAAVVARWQFVPRR
jgi:uncharacterized protein YggE